MKRLDLVQLTIIIVGIFSAFFFLLSLPKFLYGLYFWINRGMRGGEFMETLFWNIIISGAYLLAAFYCVKKSKHFAEWICNNSKLDAEVNFALDKSELLFVLFVGLGIYGLIKNLPTFLVDGFDYIKGRNNSSEVENAKAVSSHSLIIQALTLLSFFVLVYYAKVFSGFFAAKVNNTEPDDLIDTKTEE